MSSSKFASAVLAIVLCTAGAVRAEAGQTRGRAVVGRAVPRTSVAPRRVVVAPRIVGVVPYWPYYYYPYGPGLSIGFYAGYPYGYPYAYPSYGYYGYGYPPAGYVATVPGGPYGGVRIEGAAPNAQVFADGYYVGVVDDFDGTFQRLNLTAGPHRIEIRALDAQPIAFDVRVEPGQTITYHADRMR